MCIIDKVYESIPETAKNPTKKEFGCLAGCVKGQYVDPNFNQNVEGIWNACLPSCTKNASAYEPPFPSTNNPDQNNPSNADDPKTDANGTTSEAGKISEGPPKSPPSETSNETTSGKLFSNKNSKNRYLPQSLHPHFQHLHLN